MSLFGTNAGFGAGGTGVFGNTTTDSHNPMKVCLNLVRLREVLPETQYQSFIIPLLHKTQEV